jgi:thiol-disulfide isomerase/thioredoxin
MEKTEKVVWQDIKSQTMTSTEYLEKFKDNRIIIQNYTNYKPKKDVMAKIIEFLTNQNKQLKIFIQGTIWCHDSAREIPRMLKIAEEFKIVEELRILYGINVNPLRKRGESMWSGRPHEAVDPKFDLSAVPTFYFFDREGKFLGKIIERPKKSLEEDILDILKR